MRLLFTSGLGIREDQRINRWQMVTDLYTDLGQSFRALGHEIYFCIHPEAVTEKLPKALTMVDGGHESFAYVLNRFNPDFVFCWNGSSEGDIVTSTLANLNGAKMVYSEQGWFPQRDTLYFDMNGCNGRCSTQGRGFPELDEKKSQQLKELRQQYLSTVDPNGLFKDREHGSPPSSKGAVFVPLQDERDTNIVLDSPFKDMNSFLSHLLEAYPQETFFVRPHPKYPKVKVPSDSRIKMMSPKESMFEQLNDCKLVVGINSTTLLETALLGLPVVSYGRGLATGTGLFVDADLSSPPPINDINISGTRKDAVLFGLFRKQFQRGDLKKPNLIYRAEFFKEMTVNQNWKSINR